MKSSTDQEISRDTKEWTVNFMYWTLHVYFLPRHQNTKTVLSTTVFYVLNSFEITKFHFLLMLSPSLESKTTSLIIRKSSRLPITSINSLFPTLSKYYTAMTTNPTGSPSVSLRNCTETASIAVNWDSFALLCVPITLWASFYSLKCSLERSFTFSVIRYALKWRV